jgi:Ca-activated chloride channel homolog
MKFIWPYLLLLLLLAPVMLLWYRRLRKRRQRDAARLGSLGVVRESSAKPLGWQRHVPVVLFFLGITLLLFSMSRPQMQVALPQLEGTVMLVMDSSASMAADDLQPTRIEAAKTAALAFVERQPANIKIGVVAFSDGGMVVQAATHDRAATVATIKRLIPQSGTSIGQGLMVALDALAEDAGQAEKPSPADQARPTSPPAPRSAFAPAIIVMLTDGENTNEPDPLEVAQDAAEKGVRIYPIGVGSAAGTVLEIEGFNVFTQLNAEILQEIAALTEGEYFSADNEADLLDIYENLKPQFQIRAEYIEITSILAGISLLFLLSGAVLSLFWFGRVL